MTKDKKESDSLEKAHRDLVSNRPSSLVKRALDDLARLKALAPREPEHPMDPLKKRQIRVVIRNDDEQLNELFFSWITGVIKDKYALTIKSVSYGEEMKIAENAETDIFIVNVPYKGMEETLQLITQIKRTFDKPMIVFSPFELEDRVKQTGADFYFLLYDDFPIDDDFKIAFEKCIYKVLGRAS